MGEGIIIFKYEGVEESHHANGKKLRHANDYPYITGIYNKWLRH
jgi:hypothetical protein